MRTVRLLPLWILIVHLSYGQWASVRETTMVFPTYGFGDPNPVARFSNIYPYYRFEGYSLSASDQAWTVIILENPYIRVLVAPEMGGKILGAFEKKTGKDFIYFNKVVKFREIAMRGPWTSGGIEFNFGAIGHAPTTATPVDYAIDGSGPEAVCVVGAWDLASRTYWTVEIVLPPNASYVETRSTWTNRTELHTSLYHWMNAAADARKDLVFEYPGTAYIGHDGSLFDYPVAPDGNEINFYRNNARGSNKSFHVLGAYTDFFGARYEESRTGVVHWAPYTDKPGKKIWQWSQAREGAIWTDLLTDPERGNPQYVEIQNGLLFNQAAANSSETPYKHRSFAPYAVEAFSEVWFPFNGIGPIVDANPHGVLSIDPRPSAGGGKAEITVGICAVSPIEDELIVLLNGKEALRKQISLDPLESVEFTVQTDGAHTIDVTVGDKLLSYSTEDAQARTLSRPKLPNLEFDWESAHGRATIGAEHSRQRRYAEARSSYEQSLAIEPSYTPALIGLAELAYRRMEYDRAIDYASQALANDTYDPSANFIYGIASRRLGRLYDAMDALGIASSHESHRAAATVELAEIAFMRGRKDELRRALANVDLLGPHYATTARDLRLLAGMVPDREVSAKPAGPLDQSFFAAKYVLDPSRKNAENLARSIRTELPHESYLELALHYASLRRYDYALKVLERSPQHAYVDYWKAHLHHLLGQNEKSLSLLKTAHAASIELVFPHRAEDLGMFLWAEKTLPHWKTKYYLSLVLMHAGRSEEAAASLRACQMRPDESAFYLTRGSLLATTDPAQAETDLRRAHELGKDQWRVPRMLGQFLTQRGRYAEALDVLSKARRAFPENYILQFDHAQSQLFNGNAVEAVASLERTTLLPFEGARIGRDVWNKACVMAALDAMERKDWRSAVSYVEKARQWPERLGVGRPDVVDERVEDFLEARCRKELGESGKSTKLLKQVVNAPFSNTSRDLLSAIALREMRDNAKAAELIVRSTAASPTEAGYWGRAVYNGSTDVRAAFERELTQRRMSGSWEMIPDDPSFALVFEICSVLYE